jgi:hypothetical protein
VKKVAWEMFLKNIFSGKRAESRMFIAACGL